MANSEETKVKVLNRTLEKLDEQLDSMIVEIMMQKREKDLNEGEKKLSEERTVDAEITNNFNRIINSVEIISENELALINDRYNKAIDALEGAINSEDPAYKKQFEHELQKLQENKNINFDPIAETYKEISERLEKGETQKDYYQNKVDEKEVEIKQKEAEYKSKNGNITGLLVALRDDYDKVQEGAKAQEIYDELTELNKEMENALKNMKDDNLTDEAKAKNGQKYQELKGKREKKVNEFIQVTANKYPKNGKSTEEYINDLDKSKIDDDVKETCKEFNNKLKAIPEEDRRFHLIEIKDGVEKTSKRIVKEFSSVPEPEQVKKLMEDLKTQRSLWNRKAKEEGYDKQKLESERDSYREKRDNYSEAINSNHNNRRETTTTTPAVMTDTKYNDRYNYYRDVKRYGRWKSFWKAAFSKKKTEDDMRGYYQQQQQQEEEERVEKYSTIDVKDSKKEALEWLVQNKGKLQDAKGKDSDQISERDKFKTKLYTNVTATEEQLNAFWNKKEEQQSSQEHEQDSGDER